MKPLETFVSKNGREIELIPANMEKLDSIYRFVTRLAEEDTYLSFSPDRKITYEEERQWLENAIRQMAVGNNFLMWAIYNGEIVGSVDVHRGEIRSEHVGIMGLMVDKNFRGEGIGQKLLEAIMSKAKEMGFKIVILDVFSDNVPARELYKKLGLKDFGCLPKGFFRQGEYSDRMLMYKIIDEALNEQ